MEILGFGRACVGHARFKSESVGAAQGIERVPSSTPARDRPDEIA